MCYFLPLTVPCCQLHRQFYIEEYIINVSLPGWEGNMTRYYILLHRIFPCLWLGKIPPHSCSTTPYCPLLWVIIYIDYMLYISCTAETTNTIHTPSNIGEVIGAVVIIAITTVSTIIVIIVCSCCRGMRCKWN